MFETRWLRKIAVGQYKGPGLGRMEIIISNTPAEASAVAARIIARLLRVKPKAVLGLAAGGTPMLLYRELVKSKVNWRKVTTFNLDEYVGLSSEHPQSFHSFIWQHLLGRVNISRKNVHMPDGVTRDIATYCASYEKEIREAGGIDLQVLGIGSNGHIGFNEPKSPLTSRTRLTELTMQTRRSNAHFFGSTRRVPRFGITMGIATILEARHCLLLAFGSNKARIVADMVEGPVTSLKPASALQLHPIVTVCLDEAAAARLRQATLHPERARAPGTGGGATSFRRR